MREALKVHCPRIALSGDLETAPGFAAFLARFSAKERLQRMWGCSNYFRGWVYRKVRVETGGKEEPAKEQLAALVRSNSQPFLFLYHLRQRQEAHRHHPLTRGFAVPSAVPIIMLGGFYMAGIGKAPAHEQALVAGELKRLSGEQDFVMRTDKALDDDEEAYQCWARRPWGLLVLLFLAAAGLAGYRYFGLNPRPRC